MRFRWQILARSGLAAGAMAALALMGYGCSSDSAQLKANFIASVTPTTARLVKLQPLSSSGQSVTVRAVIYGPDPALDLYAFDFAVKIGNANLVHFVPGSAVAGSALTPTGGQTVVATAGPDMSDPSLIVVSVHKTGGGAGNAVPGASAVIVNLTFSANLAGSTTLSIAAAPTPTVKDSTGATIGTITFDTANGTVTGVSSGGGPY
jgi:hypothetical protein